MSKAMWAQLADKMRDDVGLQDEVASLLWDAAMNDASPKDIIEFFKESLDISDVEGNEED